MGPLQTTYQMCFFSYWHGDNYSDFGIAPNISLAIDCCEFESNEYMNTLIIRWWLIAASSNQTNQQKLLWFLVASVLLIS